jgi:hypothetical protein
VSASRKISGLDVQGSDEQLAGVSGLSDSEFDLIRSFTLNSFARASAVRLSKRFDIVLPQHAGGTRVQPMYKRKAQKVRPVDSSFSDGTNPGKLGWKEEILEGEQQGRYDKQGPYGHWLIPKFSVLGKGSRLTDERVALMQIGTDLLPQEKDLLMQVLYN